MNDTEPLFVYFNIARSFLVDQDSSSNKFYLMEADSLTSWKVSNCFGFMFSFTSNVIWKLLVSIQSRNSLDMSVKYSEHSWIGHALSLSVRLLDNSKIISIFMSGLHCMNILFLSFRSCLISEIWWYASWMLNVFSTELCLTLYFLHICRNTSNLHFYPN